jgi:hypothetical protein
MLKTLGRENNYKRYKMRICLQGLPTAILFL